MISYTDAKWVRVLRLEFGCTYSRIREILIQIYGPGLQKYSGGDIVAYASLLLGKDIEDEHDEIYGE